LQQGQKIRKWEERARFGIYLGPSPQHAKSVTLVFSLTTGNVFPQYLVQFDDLFEMVTKENEQYIPKLEWQVKTHFQKQARTLKTPTNPVVTPDISPDISILPPQLQTPTPQMTPELEQCIVDQPLPEPKFEPAVVEPVVDLEAPLQEQQQEPIQQPVRCSTR